MLLSMADISFINLDNSINSGNFYVSDYLTLIWKDSSTHIHGLAVYIKEGFPFTWDLSSDNSVAFYLCFGLALFHSTSFFPIDHFLCLYAQFLMLFHLT